MAFLHFYAPKKKKYFFAASLFLHLFFLFFLSLSVNVAIICENNIFLDSKYMKSQYASFTASKYIFQNIGCEFISLSPLFISFYSCISSLHSSAEHIELATRTMSVFHSSQVLEISIGYFIVRYRRVTCGSYQDGILFYEDSSGQCKCGSGANDECISPDTYLQSLLRQLHVSYIVSTYKANRNQSTD